MKVIIESHIPYIKGLLEEVAQVEYLEPEEITKPRVAQADALIVRTRTHCNEQLLAGSKCQFIGTATIGTDHIDLDYCHSAGIKVCNAAGCNAPAVAQYVLACIGHWLKTQPPTTRDSQLTLGIVGVGHVGKIVERFAQESGLKVLLNDPPRALAEGTEKFVGLDVIAKECDIITFHTPLTKNGEFATHHLCDNNFLRSLAKCKLLINSSRGAVVDNQALAQHLTTHNLSVAIDCWENEPTLNPTLLSQALIATPHIAGYSQEGKKRGTAMIIEQLNEYFGWNITPPEISPITPTAGATGVTLERITQSYNPLIDTALLKASPAEFERLRNFYALRGEVHSHVQIATT